VRSLDGSVVSVLTNPRSGDRLDTVYRALCIQEENTVRVWPVARVGDVLLVVIVRGLVPYGIQHLEVQVCDRQGV
jgi:hypothetical protein